MAANSTDRVLRGSPRFDDAAANALRALAMDAEQAANWGHPGAAMGMAEMATALR
jgi:transketolase